jgi:aspartyl-tRNA(Asn)/glutamyl-tRNA(Gln) amidotransferase subunit B
MPVPDEIRKKYIPTIGIECHVQLKTKTKLFSASGNDAREAPPNTLISHIDIALPGALPVLNEKAVELAVRTAYVLNTEPQKHSYFERKHYFYPDSPAGYQISQLQAPIIVGGYVEIEVESERKRININRVQLEADAGKNTHPTGADYTLVDLNRAGTPLLEIVGEPDIHSAAEAKAYARELYLLMKYADVSEADLYHGNIRFDVNVSVSKDPNKKGLRAEVKNLNSFRSVENAVLYEIDRQIELLENGEQVTQETRGWDEDAQKTTSQRNKEEAHDYRYMPEPDIPPIVLGETFINTVKGNVPKLPPTIREDLKKLDIGNKVTEDILDNPEVYRKVEKALQKNAFVESVRRLAFDSLEEPKTLNISVEDHIKVADMLSAKLISSTAAKEILVAKLDNPDKSVEELSEDKKQVSDEGEIEKIVSEVIAENPKAAEDVANGEMKAIGFLVGHVMKKSQGKANPGLAQEIIKRQLGV